MSKTTWGMLAGFAVGCALVWWMWPLSPRSQPAVDRPEALQTRATREATAVLNEEESANPPADDGADPSVAANVPSGPVEETTPAGEPASEQGSAKAKSEPPRPMLQGWEGVRAALIFTGEQHGYVEPCGCSLKQLGGLSRRADFFRQLGEREIPVAAFDLGGLVNRPTRKQGKLKLQMALHGLKDMRYAGVGLGPEELRNGIELITYEERPPFVACNVVLAQDPNLGLVEPFVIAEAGGLKVAVTAVYGPSLQAEVQAQVDASEVEVQDPAKELPKVFEAMRATQPDLMVLLLHAQGAETRQLAGLVSGWDVVVATGGPEEPNPRRVVEGGTLWVWPGQKGKAVSVVGVFEGTGAERLRYEPVSLDEDRFRDTPAMRDHMRHYQEMLALQKLVATEPAIEYPRNVAESGENPYVGAETCGECHTRAYAHWKTTGHARGTVSIIQGRAGQEGDYISRIEDPECVSCHVTGWDPQEVVRYKSGWVDQQTSAHLAGQQCENCHGPGGRHSELERQVAAGTLAADATDVGHWRNFAALVSEEAFDLCARCHDGDNDPHFHTPTFPEYWEKVKHPWRD
jgi:hypothetical protein